MATVSFDNLTLIDAKTLIAIHELITLDSTDWEAVLEAIGYIVETAKDVEYMPEKLTKTYSEILETLLSYQKEIQGAP